MPLIGWCRGESGMRPSRMGVCGIIIALCACNNSSGTSGPLRTPDWIRSRSAGGVSMEMSPASIRKALMDLGYDFHPTKSPPTEDDIISAHGVMRHRNDSEICADQGAKVSLSIRMRNDRVIDITCFSNSMGVMPEPTRVFIDTANSFKNTSIKSYSVDDTFDSYRSLMGAELCPTLRSNEFKDASDIEFCKTFKRSRGPYAFYYSIDNGNLSQTMKNRVTIHN